MVSKTLAIGLVAIVAFAAVADTDRKFGWRACNEMRRYGQRYLDGNKRYIQYWNFLRETQDSLRFRNKRKFNQRKKKCDTKAKGLKGEAHDFEYVARCMLKYIRQQCTGVLDVKEKNFYRVRLNYLYD